MALRTQIRGQEQIQQNTVDRDRLVANFLAGSNLNLTDGANNATLAGLAAGALDNDAVNLGQMNSAIQAAISALSKATKDPVATISLTNITLTGLQTVGGLLLVDGQRVAVVGQSIASEDGIYLASSTAWTRTDDAQVGEDLGAKLFAVDQGDEADTLWLFTNDEGEGIVGTDDLEVEKVGDGAVAPPTEVCGELPTITNGSADVTLANLPITGTLKVFLNGSRLSEGASLDYTVSGQVITFAEILRTVPAAQADIVSVDYKYT